MIGKRTKMWSITRAVLLGWNTMMCVCEGEIGSLLTSMYGLLFFRGSMMSEHFNIGNRPSCVSSFKCMSSPSTHSTRF